MNQTSSGPKTGRPPGAKPKTVMGGKGRALSANISQEVRDALEAEATKTGRSISQITERHLENALKGHASYEQLLGGNELARAIEVMIKFYPHAKKAFGDPMTDSGARVAIIAGLCRTLELAIPLFEIDDETAKKGIAQHRLTEAVKAEIEPISHWWESSPHRDKAEFRLVFGPILARPADVRDTPGLLRFIERVLGAPDLDAETAQAVKRLQSAITDLRDVVELDRQRLEQKARLGRGLADTMTAPDVSEVWRSLAAERLDQDNGAG